MQPRTYEEMINLIVIAFRATDKPNQDFMSGMITIVAIVYNTSSNEVIRALKAKGINVPE